MALLTPPPTAPQRGDRATFASRVDAFITWLINFVSELLALVANLNSIAAGGAYAITYTVNTGTAGGGVVAMYSSSDQLGSTEWYLGETDISGKSLTKILDTFTTSNSLVKGTIRIVKMNDPSQWISFALLSLTPNGTFRTATVQPIDGSAAAVFGTGDAVLLSFQRTGDKGDTGLTGPIGPAGGGFALLGSANITTAVANIDFLSLFSDTYDNYRVDLLGILPSASDALYLRFATGGAVDTNNVYTNNFVASSTITASSSSTTLCNGSSVPTTGIGTTLTIDIRNARSTTRNKSYGARGQSNGAVVTGEAIYANTTAISGLRLYWGAGNTFAAGKVLVYGVKNS